jgi:hypothetical protein
MDNYKNSESKLEVQNIETLCVCVCGRACAHSAWHVTPVYVLFTLENTSHKEDNTNALPNYQSALA